MDHPELRLAMCVLDDFGRVHDDALRAAPSPRRGDEAPDGIHLYVMHGKQEPRPKLFVPRAMASAIRKKDRKASAGLCRFVANVETEMMRAQYDWPTPAILALKGRTGASGGVNQYVTLCYNACGAPEKVDRDLDRMDRIDRR